MSSSRSSMYFSPLRVTSVPPYLEIKTLSPTFTSNEERFPSSRVRPNPTATTVASCDFSLAESGIMMPPFIFHTFF